MYLKDNTEVSKKVEIQSTFANEFVDKHRASCFICYALKPQHMLFNQCLRTLWSESRLSMLLTQIQFYYCKSHRASGTTEEQDRI